MRAFRTIAALVTLTSCQPAEDPLIAKAKEAVAEKVKDPASAQFKDVNLCKTKGMVQGQFNAKNSFGAYTGYETFFFIDGTAFMIGSFPFDAANEKDRAYFAHLAVVCYHGGDPSLGTFYGYSSPSNSGDANLAGDNR